MSIFAHFIKNTDITEVLQARKNTNVLYRAPIFLYRLYLSFMWSSDYTLCQSVNIEVNFPPTKQVKWWPFWSTRVPSNEWRKLHLYSYETQKDISLLDHVCQNVSTILFNVIIFFGIVERDLLHQLCVCMQKSTFWMKMKMWDKGPSMKVTFHSTQMVEIKWSALICLYQLKTFQ